MVDPLLRTGTLLTTSNACVLCKLRATHLGRTQGPGYLPEVETHPDPSFIKNAIEARIVSVALPLVAIEVVPPTKLVMAEPKREPGARLPPREPLLVARLPVAAEVHRGLPEGPSVPVARHAGFLY